MKLEGTLFLQVKYENKLATGSVPCKNHLINMVLGGKLALTPGNSNKTSATLTRTEKNGLSQQ